MESRLIQQYPTLNISPVSHQMKAMYRYMLQILNSEMAWTDPETGEGRLNECKIGWFLKKHTENPLPIIYFENNSIFYGRSVHDDKGKGLAGSQFAYISYDECVLSHHLQEELAGNIISRLIKWNGNLDLIGTPNSASPSNQHYLHIVKKGLEEKDGWFAMRGMLDDNIFFTKENREEIKQMLKETNPDQYHQVVFGDFLEASSGYFSPQQVDGLFNESIQYEEPRADRRYIMSADWAVAKNDYTVFIVIDYTKKPFRVVHITRFQGNEFKPQEQYGIARELHARYFEPLFVSDSGGMGGSIIENELSDIVTYGFRSGGTGEMKSAMLLALKEMMAVGDLVCPYDPTLEEELGTYQVDDKKLRQDMVMTLGMAAWYIKENFSEFTDQPININIFRQ